MTTGSTEGVATDLVVPRVVISTVGITAPGPWKAARDAAYGAYDRCARDNTLELTPCRVREAMAEHLNPNDGYVWDDGRLAVIPSRAAPPELSGMFVPGAPLCDAGRDSQTFGLRVADGTHIVLIVPADGEQDQVHGNALATLGCIADDFVVSEVTPDKLDLTPRSLPYRGASGEMLRVKGMDTRNSEALQTSGLGNFAAAMAQVLTQYRDYEVDVCATAGTKSQLMVLAQLLALVRGIIGDRTDEQRKRRVARVATLTTVFDGALPPRALQHLIPPSQLPHAWWSEKLRTGVGAPKLGDGQAGSFLVSGDQYDSPAAEWLFEQGSALAFDFDHDDDVARQLRRDTIFDVIERVKSGAAQARAELWNMPKVLLPDGGKPNSGRVFGAELLLSQRADPELAASGFLPQQDLVHRLAIAKVKMLVQACDEHEPQRRETVDDPPPAIAEPVARAVAAIADWCDLFAPAPAGRPAQIVERLDSRTDDLRVELEKLDAALLPERNLMLEQIVRASLLPRFELKNAAALVHACPFYLGICALWMPLLALVGGCLWRAFDALTGWPGVPSVPSEYFAIGASVATVVGTLLIAREVKHVGALATDPLILRLAGACAIGAVAIVGLADVVREFARGLAEGHLVGAGVIVVAAALALTFVYLHSERAGGSPEHGIRRSALVGVVGLGYSLIVAFLLTPLALQIAHADDKNAKHGAAFITAAYHRDVSLLATLVIASLALLLGVLSQVFWSDRTAVDPL